MLFLKNDKTSSAQHFANRSAEQLLTHLMIEDGTIPEVCCLEYFCSTKKCDPFMHILNQVFGIKFDQLTTKAVAGLVISGVFSALPSIATFVIKCVHHDECWN